MGQFVSTFADHDEAGSASEYTDETGGTGLHFSPGLRYRFRGLIALSAIINIPYTEDLNQYNSPLTATCFSALTTKSIYFNRCLI